MEMFNRSNTSINNINMDTKNTKVYNLIRNKDIEVPVTINAEKDMANGIYYFDYYHPWHGGLNSEFNDISSRLLDLKRGKTYAVNIYCKKLLSSLYNSFSYLKKYNMLKKVSIAVVPSHTEGINASVMKGIAEKLVRYYGIISAVNCLVRTITISKLANGGCRDKSIHLNSIKVFNEELIKDKEVILIDDITTSGNSLLACKRLLMDKGAQNVLCVAMGKTV